MLKGRVGVGARGKKSMFLTESEVLERKDGQAQYRNRGLKESKNRLTIVSYHVRKLVDPMVIVSGS